VNIKSNQILTYHIENMIPHVELMYSLYLSCYCVKWVLRSWPRNLIYFLFLSNWLSNQLWIEKPLLRF